MSAFAAENAVRLLAVVVLYQRKPADSEAFQSLLKTRERLPQTLDLSILLFDNTPGNVERGPLPEAIAYHAPGGNQGLAAAYSYALAIAHSQASSWLLLLDQDTELPPDFLELVCQQIQNYQANEAVVALVPTVRSDTVVVSPKTVGFFRLKSLPRSTFGIRDAETTAINSGTLLRCDFLQSIGGFNRAYRLDYLDHWLFHKIYVSGKKVAVTDCTLDHKLSVLDYRKNVGPTRYRSILQGESAFVTTYKSTPQVCVYLARLLFRAMRLTMHMQSGLALSTMSMFVKIAMHPTRSLEEDPQ